MSWTNLIKGDQSVWSNLAKIVNVIQRGRLLTPDSNQILVGADENLILIYQEYNADGDWQKTEKTSSTWTNLTKAE